jgi:thiol-disulfide isomerase/thioredoxin
MKMHHRRPSFTFWITLVGLLFLGFDVPAFDTSAVPQINGKGLEHLSGRYAQADKNKAFFIGPAGSWAWKSGKGSIDEALQQTNERCKKHIEPINCIPYAINDEVVFDPQAWAAALAPYPKATDGQIGPERGDRLYDIRFTTSDGQPRKLSDYRGKVVVFHVWGSWCPPCQYEMPSLNRLYEMMKNNPDVVFIPVSVNETYRTSKAWADDMGFTLPYVDADANDGEFALANGDSLGFREVAPKVPTTFFIARDGTVVFRKVKAFQKWEDFRPQLEHLISAGNS